MIDILLDIGKLLLALIQIAGFVYFIRWVRSKGGRLESIGTWSALEKHFGTPTIPESYTYTSGLIGLGTYEDTLKLAYGDKSIFVDVPHLFRFGGKPLLIPYGELTVSEKNPTVWYQFRTYTQFKVRGGTERVHCAGRGPENSGA